MARRRGGGKGPGSLSMGGMGRKPPMMGTPMASAPTGPPGGLGGPGPAGPSPGPLGVKKGGHVTKHARGGMAGEESPRHERGESKAVERKEHMKFEKGGEVKARVRAGRDNC
jgi:hypothetical protein